MRLDTANRSFAGLLGASLLVGMLAFCAGIGCVLIALVVARVADNGVAGLASDEAAFWPTLAFIGIVGAGAAVGVASLRRQLRASRDLSRRVRTMQLALPAQLEGAARRRGLAGRVTLVDSEQRFSFAYGAFTPRVAVSRGLWSAASAEELDAVLEHERYHVRNLDPLKVLLTRTLATCFFYVPILGDLHVRYIAGRELAADRSAVEAQGRGPLAGALYKVVRGPSWPELQAAAAIGGAELLDARVAQLESGTEPPLSGLRSRSVLFSLFGAGSLSVFSSSPSSVSADPRRSRTSPAGVSPRSTLRAPSSARCPGRWAGGLVIDG